MQCGEVEIACCVVVGQILCRLGRESTAGCRRGRELDTMGNMGWALVTSSRCSVALDKNRHRVADDART